MNDIKRIGRLFASALRCNDEGHLPGYRDQECLSKMTTDENFRAMAYDLADGLGLSIVQFSEQRLVLAPKNTESVFCLSPYRYLRQLGLEYDRSFILFLQIGIAQTLLPYVREITDVDMATQSAATRSNIAETLLGMTKNAGSIYQKLMTYVQQMPRGSDDVESNSPGTLYGAIEILLKYMRDERYLDDIIVPGYTYYMPSRRYVLMLQLIGIERLYKLLIKYSSKKIFFTGDGQLSLCTKVK